MKPTCCAPLRPGMKLIAVIDLLVSIIAFLLSGGALIYFEMFSEDVLKYFKNPPPQFDNFINLKNLEATPFRILAGFGVVYWLQKIVLGVVLIIGTFKEKRSLLRIWIVYTLILLVFSVLSYFAVLSLEVAEPYSIPFYVVVFLTREYTVWCVYAFLKRIQFGKNNFPAFSNDKVTYKL